MDELTTLLQQSSQRNRIAYQSKQVKQQKLRDRQTPHATKVGHDSSVGLDTVEVNGSTIYADSVTNGAIGAGDSVELHLARIDQMPAPKPKPKPVAPKPLQSSPVKILFSVMKDQIQEFWIGGDRLLPQKIYSIDT